MLAERPDIMPQKRALAIHDISCIGRCSLTVALPILSAAGIETALLPTALLSSQTVGFEHYVYRDLTDELLPIEQHWKRLGLGFDAMYSGFLGSARQVDVVAEVFEDFRGADNLILVDPVMADCGQLYPVFTPEMAVCMRRLVRKADLIIPNLTEASLLLEEPYVERGYDEAYIRALLRRLSGLGCEKTLLTGVSLRPGRLGAACYDAGKDVFAYYDAGYVDQVFHGTGDVFGSALLAALLNGFSLPEAMAAAVDYTRRCIDFTVEEGREAKYGPCFERATPYLLQRLGLGCAAFGE